MKKFYFFLIVFSVSFVAFAQNEFITTWEVTSSDLSITIPTTGTGYNYTVDFGDGNSQTNVTGDATHTYNAAGIYTVSISGNFPRIYFHNDQPNANKILSVVQWGNNQWQSMEAAFAGCANLEILATDVPVLSQVTKLDWMFNSATSFNQPINNWDVSNVTSMRGMFYNTTSFNQPLNNWDVSNVTDMSYLFNAANSFNQPINNWNVSQVTNMELMFGANKSFNQPLNNWDVSNVTDMEKMFNSSVFNQPINSWNVSNVTTMKNMFAGSEFNQELNNWNVSNVTNMDLMFGQCNFNQPLDNWDVSNVSTMFSIFFNNKEFNQNLSTWNFHPDVNLLESFYSSGLDVTNYDALLEQLVNLGYPNKTMIAKDLFYCNEKDRNFLINNLNWSISNDTLDENCSLSTEASEFLSISLFPNPASSTIYIENNTTQKIIGFEIFNLQGKKIKTLEETFQQIDISKLSRGIYFIKLFSKENSRTFKLVKS